MLNINVHKVLFKVEFDIKLYEFNINHQLINNY